MLLAAIAPAVVVVLLLVIPKTLKESSRKEDYNRAVTDHFLLSIVLLNEETK